MNFTVATSNEYDCYVAPSGRSDACRIISVRCGPPMKLLVKNALGPDNPLRRIVGISRM